MPEVIQSWFDVVMIIIAIIVLVVGLSVSIHNAAESPEPETPDTSITTKQPSENVTCYIYDDGTNTSMSCVKNVTRKG